MWLGAYSAPGTTNTPVITTSTLAGGTVGTLYNQQLTAIGTNGPVAWSVEAGLGTLPPGLTLTPAGLITGTPTSANTFNFTIEVTDSLGQEAFAALSITVASSAGVGGAPNLMFQGFTDSSHAVVYWWVPTTQLSWCAATMTASMSGSNQLAVTAITGFLYVGDTVNIPGGSTLTVNTAPLSNTTGNYTLSGTASFPSQQITKAAGVIPDFYEVFRNGTQVGMASPPLTNAGVTASPIIAPTGRAMSWHTDTTVLPATTYSFQVRAVTGGQRSPFGPTLMLTTRAAVPFIAPTPAAEPNGWIANLQSALAAALAATSPIICHTQTDLNNALTGVTPGVNVNGPNVFVCDAGGHFAIPTFAGFQPLAFTGTGGWTFVISSELPEYKAGGKLPAYDPTVQFYVNAVGVATGTIPITALSANLAANLLMPDGSAMTDASGNWLKKSGWYHVAFTEPTLVVPNGSLHEERLCIFTQGSPTFTWNTHNNNYPVNTINAFGAITGGSGYSNGTYIGLLATGGSGTVAWLSVVVAGGAVTSISEFFGGNNYLVNDVLSVPIAANFSGYIAGTALTYVSGSTSIVPSVGAALSGAGVLAGTVITGGASPNFTVNNSQTVGSAAAPVTITATGSGFSVPVTGIFAGGGRLTAPANATFHLFYLKGVTGWDANENAAMPTIDIGSTQNGLALQLNPSGGTSKMWIAGFNFHTGPNLVNQAVGLVRLGTIGLGPDGTGDNTIPLSDSIYLDRCVLGSLAGDSDYGHVSHAIGWTDTTHLLVNQCYIMGIATNPNNSGQDANNFGQNGQFHCIQNSYLSCVGECWIYGGIYLTQNNIPSDVVFRGNLAHKPLDWVVGACDGKSNGSSPPYTRFGINAKTVLENKVGHRFSYYGNMVLNNWVANQSGYLGAGLSIGTRAAQGLNVDRNGSDPWVNIQDIDIHDNLFYRVQTVGYFFTGEQTPSVFGARVFMHNNLSYHSPPLCRNDRGQVFEIFGPCADHGFTRHTSIINKSMNVGNQGVYRGIYFPPPAGGTNTPSSLYLGSPSTLGNWPTSMDGFLFTDNILDCGGNNWAIFVQIATQPWAFPHVTWNKILTINDTNTYGGNVSYPNVPYTSIGFFNYTGNQTMPLHPSDLNVTQPTIYQTGSSTGGPMGCTFGIPMPAAKVGVAYSQALAQGAPPFSTISVPAWATVSTAGLVTGTPSVSELDTIVVLDSANQRLTFAVSVNS